eukprot:21037-Heterococcus_DN1.PRE.3
MLDIHDNLRLVVSHLQRLVPLHTEVVQVQLQSCMSHKHGGRMRHRVCSGCPAGASLLYVTIQRSSLFNKLTVALVKLIVDANAVWCKHYDDISPCESGTNTLIARVRRCTRHQLASREGQLTPCHKHIASRQGWLVLGFSSLAVGLTGINKATGKHEACASVSHQSCVCCYNSVLGVKTVTVILVDSNNKLSKAILECDS